MLQEGGGVRWRKMLMKVPLPPPSVGLVVFGDRRGVCSEWNEGVAFMSQEAPPLPTSLITSCVWLLLTRLKPWRLAFLFFISEMHNLVFFSFFYTG